MNRLDLREFVRCKSENIEPFSMKAEGLEPLDVFSASVLPSGRLEEQLPLEGSQKLQSAALAGLGSTWFLGDVCSMRGAKSTQDFRWSVPLKIGNIVRVRQRHSMCVFCVLTCHSADNVDFHTDE